MEALAMTLRTDLLKIASELPKGDPTRREILSALHTHDTAKSVGGKQADDDEELVEDHLIFVVRSRTGMGWLKKLLGGGFQAYSAAGASLASSKYKGTPIDNIISKGDASAVIISPSN